ncbi:MAG: hypothetical protein M3367_05890 [Acidobacteriota bacterium]|nr:hypothetical protein [Acidobacteriota bacterium]
MGKSTIVYKGPSNQVQIRYSVSGYKNGNTSGNFVTSGWVDGSSQTIEVSGYDSYQFCLFASGVSVAGPDFSDGDTQAVTVLFGAGG